jgi:hypothetical protein
MGGAHLTDVDHVVDRLRLDASPAIRQCVCLCPRTLLCRKRTQAPN